MGDLGGEASTINVNGDEHGSQFTSVRHSMLIPNSGYWNLCMRSIVHQCQRLTMVLVDLSLLPNKDLSFVGPQIGHQVTILKLTCTS